MGWSGAEARCKKHPKQRQSPGVCSACLRDRLSQLSSSNKTKVSLSTSSSDVSSYYSSASSPSSPVEISFNGYDLATFNHVKRGLFRSRTVAVVPEKRTAEEQKKKKKKGGFWSKLIQATSKKRKEVDLHSKTYKEETAGAWVSARK
ncbi:uncharacterized protein [Aristolochia californica]|uniref:uncharacterized protein n=1 Tax=Aristolochia californica TaxID=171875 RepID=UPI0035D75176